ncbi:MAG: NAD(P)-binding protein [Rhizobiales bacterium]|nr:NAD(P)-binding protein [Hyphomicrobiales bacterium]
MSKVHVIGAGLAGLSAAVQLVQAGASVVLHEQAGHAGGRTRSFHDATLDAVIDNGNHLLLSGNTSALNFLTVIGARGRLTGPRGARFDFFDLETSDRWNVDLTRGPVPLWVLYKDRRVPGTNMTDYLKGLKLLTAGNRSVAALFGDQGQIYRRFWEPFSVAVLNTPADVAAARLLMPVIRETLAKGADASKPLIAKNGLSDSFVDPALNWLERHGAEIRFNARVDKIVRDDRKVTALASDTGMEIVGRDDGVVLAVPPWAAAALIDGVAMPNKFAPIVNVHFKLETAELPGMTSPLLGMVGSVSHWIFKRDNVVSVTISAADDLARLPNDEIAKTVWNEVRQAIGLDGSAQPPVRVIKERRATFVATPDQLARRPASRTDASNLALAGDWVDTGLPATIEGAIRSGELAAGTLRKLTA